MSEPESDGDVTNVINFAEKFFERRGKELEELPDPAGHDHEAVDPEKDLVAKLALQILDIIKTVSVERPITTLAALQLVGTTVGIDLIRRYGKEQASKIAVTALARSKVYAPVFRE